MCGIVGYLGRGSARNAVLEGLRQLEYRGYDSAGFVCFCHQTSRLRWVKAVGPFSELERRCQTDPFDGVVGIGHTRWATHGAATEENAHPHFNTEKSIAVVHNGIIENFSEHRYRLSAGGCSFSSETDTEVIAHLFGEALSRYPGDLNKALRLLASQLEGAFACVLMSSYFPDKLFLLRRRSPLCVGVGEDAFFVASDPLAFAEKTARVVFLPDESCAVVSVREGLSIFSPNGTVFDVPEQRISSTWHEVARGGFDHFMLKEIYEQKKVVQDTVSYCRSLTKEEWDNGGFARSDVERICAIGCGTSAYAASVAAYFFEEIAHLSMSVSLASEFRYKTFFGCQADLFCFLSQSGETADTLEALRLVQKKGFSATALVNVPTSSMVREADGVLLTQARREVAVASTKSFTAQVALLYWVAHRMAVHRGLLDRKMLLRAEDDLLLAAEVLEEAMIRYEPEIALRLSSYYAAYEKFIFLGRGQGFAFAGEAALKYKEIVYAFVDCYPAGELKHGPIALIDERTPVCIFSTLDSVVYRKLLVNAQEVKARGGHLLVFCFAEQEELLSLADEAFVFPRVAPLLASIAMVGVMQLLVYHCAVKLNRPVDKPRNLAKSVTVE
ncbi:MAG: glutamine--fructose-6-phosphate transaminase (isomerizing) [Candidatus Babeliaceae bacterium]|nr:glutamine--fructose-6-phosphate transaminase (isomerizing) [Candidatus Babeliaceae bacterium]